MAISSNKCKLIIQYLNNAKLNNVIQKKICYGKLERQFASSSVFSSYINSVPPMHFLTLRSNQLNFPSVSRESSLLCRHEWALIRSDHSASFSLRLQPWTDLEHQTGSNSLAVSTLSVPFGLPFASPLSWPPNSQLFPGHLFLLSLSCDSATRSAG